MRTIKFRGKRAKGECVGEWAYGELTQHDNLIWLVECEPDTIGQFTGLHDANGKEIYEGDILLWTRKNVHIEGRPIQDLLYKCIIYYDNDKLGFRFRCKLDCGSCVGNLDFSDDRAKESYIEVIGNIYDNPELLNK